MTMTRVSPPRNAGLPRPELDHLKRRMRQERAELLDLYNHDLHAGQAMHDDAADDSADRALTDHEREMVFTLSDAEREQLRLIDEALDRMRNGTYGYCLYTGKPIPMDRLRAVPWARMLAEIQAQEEEGILR
jgi:DnaK suppressor protein